MKIIIQNEEELLLIAREAIHIIANLRKYTKLWEKNHGFQLKNNKKYHEERADAFISKLQVVDHVQAHEIKIEVNKPV